MGNGNPNQRVFGDSGRRQSWMEGMRTRFDAPYVMNRKGPFDGRYGRHVCRPQELVVAPMRLSASDVLCGYGRLCWKSGAHGRFFK